MSWARVTGGNTFTARILRESKWAVRRISKPRDVAVHAHTRVRIAGGGANRLESVSHLARSIFGGQATPLHFWKMPFAYVDH